MIDDNLAHIQTSAIKVRELLLDFQKKDRRWDRFLKGACATASYLLQQELAQFGIDSWMVHADHKDSLFGEHVWLETEHFSIDLTYSQFDKKETIVITCKSNDQYDDFCGHFFSQKIVGVDYFDSWPAAQRPTNCIKRMNNKKKKAIAL